MVFTTDKSDFYISDFITYYEHDLPHVVMVSQGYGSFNKGQVNLVLKYLVHMFCTSHG